MTFNQDYLKTLKWQLKTFGGHFKWKGVLDHIEKEILEIRENPDDLEEWIDLMFLSFGGACDVVKHHQPKATPEEVVAVVYSAYKSKLRKNINRKWPDWRTVEPDKAIEHIKETVE